MADVVLSPDLSRAELVRAFREYSDYDLVESLTRAKLYIQAGRMLLATPLKRSASQIRGDEVELDPVLTQELIAKAETWYFARYRAEAGTELPTQYTIDEDWRSGV